ncbi:hypothetical protein CCMA1212_009164, partial [Trichoderma ghanense]
SPGGARSRPCRPLESQSRPSLRLSFTSCPFPRTLSRILFIHPLPPRPDPCLFSPSLSRKPIPSLFLLETAAKQLSFARETLRDR